MTSITIDIRKIFDSGIGTFIQNILPILISNKPDFTFNLLCYKNELSQLEWVSAKNVNLIDCSSRQYSIKEQIEIPFKIPKNTDIFWMPHFNIPILPVNARKKIVTIHDVFHLAFWKDLSWPQKIYSKLIINHAVRNFDKVITVSKFSKNEIIKYTKINEKKIKTIYNGINFEKYCNINNDNSLTRLPEKYILYVGNVKPHKNITGLIRAFMAVEPEIIAGYKLLIVGKKEGFIINDEKLQVELENNPLLKDKITFTGKVSEDELINIYKNADMLVFPSFYEGFGLPPLEAMASDCPVICSTAASLPEVCGEAVMYCNPYDHIDIAEKIKKLILNKEIRNRLIEKGRIRAKYFKWNECAHKYLDIFEKLLN
ncbi:MAG: glycosyltransferase family 1 protein [Candidatus Wallbacteria bacterium]